MHKAKNLFIVGRPGVGKTTLLVDVANQLTYLRLGGFYTREIREAGQRTGFCVETFTGQSVVFAHVSVKSSMRVGKYGVDIAAFERTGVAALEAAIQTADVIFVDEIGKMELFSDKFCALVLRALDSSKPVLATVMARANPFVDTLKRRADVKLIEINVLNRDRLITELANELRRLCT